MKVAVRNSLRNIKKECTWLKLHEWISCYPNFHQKYFVQTVFPAMVSNNKSNNEIYLKKNLKKLNSVEISVYKCQLSDVFIQLVLLNIKLQVLCTQKYDDLHAINQYLHVMRSTLFEGGFSLSFANIEERLPLIFEKSAETGRY